MRRAVGKEVVRLLDAAIAGAWRAQAALVYGAETAGRLLPEAPGEALDRDRFYWLWGLATASMPPPKLTGSGPLGMLTPVEVQQLVLDLQGPLRDASPKIRQLMTQPGALDFANEVATGLAARATARSVKLWVGGGIQALFTSGGGSKADVGPAGGPSAAGMGLVSSPPAGGLSWTDAARIAAANFATELKAGDESQHETR